MKRFFDVLLSLMLIILLSPIFIIIAILVRFNLGSPVIYKQERAGYKGAPFTIFKFKTMLESKDKLGNYLPDEERVTKFGIWLRSTSLDEIPGLFNVFTGEMSFVGPRPLFMSYIPLYSNEQKRRLSVKPGITGWAQINGRNSISWKERFELDVWYIENRNMLLDLKIIILTIVKVIKREGVNSQGHVTMEVFKGNN